jgi:branched-chain amino acid aminotransferase
VTVYNVDGELVDRKEATVSVDDRGFRYGDGAFETCRAYGGTVFLWGKHRERLEQTCETLGMREAVPGDLRARIDETLAANDLAEAYVRVSVTRGVQPGKLTPDEDVDPTVVVYVKPLPAGGTDGEAVWDDPATVESVATRRIPDSALPADAKTQNYLNGILARLELRESERGADESLMCDLDGYVAEGATSNLFFVDDGTLMTPEAGSILPGITRGTVLELADWIDVPSETGRYTVGDVRRAEEAFLTNTTWEIRPIARLDGAAVGGGPVTDRLRRAYDETVDRRCYGDTDGSGNEGRDGDGQNL